MQIIRDFAELETATKRISISLLERCVNGGVITKDGANYLLKTVNYPDYERDLENESEAINE